MWVHTQTVREGESGLVQTNICLWLYPPPSMQATVLLEVGEDFWLVPAAGSDLVPSLKPASALPSRKQGTSRKTCGCDDGNLHAAPLRS